MKLELEAGPGSGSEYSCDSQSSQGSGSGSVSCSSAAEYAAQSAHTRAALTLASLEGLNSGVPTRTTATLTPTHLRNIEQTFIELQCRSEQGAPHVGFVPPPIATQANHYGILNQVGYGDGCAGPIHVSPGPVSSSGDSSSSPELPAPKRRNMGGRRPTKAPLDISPEEEERRNLRRERNKMAAARCRKRRLDHTNELVEETEGLERKKQSLQDEIRQLNQSCEQLQYVLDNHRLHCRLNKRAPTPPDVKPFQPMVSKPLDDYPLPMPDDGVRVKVEVEVNEQLDHNINLDSDIFTMPHTDKRVMLSAANPQVLTSNVHDLSSSLDTPPITTKPNRPSFLQVPFNITPAQVHGIKNGGLGDLPGIDISTPSTGIPFNFDSLMDGGTGLTPVQPCATQQHIKSHPEVMISPDTALNNKLVSL